MFFEHFERQKISVFCWYRWRGSLLVTDSVEVSSSDFAAL